MAWGPGDAKMSSWQEPSKCQTLIQGVGNSGEQTTSIPSPYMIINELRSEAVDK